MSSKPVVFISSTGKGLKQHRERAARAALASGFFPEMTKCFPASGQPAISACLEEAAGAGLLIAIVAHRYGWVRNVSETPTLKLFPTKPTAASGQPARSGHRDRLLKLTLFGRGR